MRAENGLTDQVSKQEIHHEDGLPRRDTSSNQYNAFNIDYGTLRAALTRDFGVAE